MDIIDALGVFDFLGRRFLAPAFPGDYGKIAGTDIVKRGEDFVADIVDQIELPSVVAFNVHRKMD